MKSLDAVAQVLKELGKPLHYREITKRILDQGLWQTQGKTPEYTINANLAVDIKKHGEESRFQRTDKGIFALRSWGLPEFIITPKKETEKQPLGRPKKTYTFNDAAAEVLAMYGDRQPMHYRDITDKILELELVYTEGKTPEATLYAQLLREIKTQQRRGETPRFVMHGKGYFGLRKWMGEGLAFRIQQHNDQVRKKLYANLRDLTASEFESLVAQLLVALGFEDVNMTPMSRDGGIDVRGTLVVGDVVRTRMAVQAKKWKKNVHAPIVQQVRGSLGAHEQGLIITTSGFSKGAVLEAERPDAIPVALMDGRQMVDLLIENDIGVTRTSYDLIELSPDEKGNVRKA